MCWQLEHIIQAKKVKFIQNKQTNLPFQNTDTTVGGSKINSYYPFLTSSTCTKQNKSEKQINYNFKIMA